MTRQEVNEKLKKMDRATAIKISNSGTTIPTTKKTVKKPKRK